MHAEEVRRKGNTMATVELRNLRHSYAGASSAFAIEDLNITWEDGTANALLGPSGCGKTTLLNIISGLLKPTGGQVLLGGRDVTNRSPKERKIAQVFQFPVVYDTMNVFDNLAFPLRNAGTPERAVRKRVAEIAEILDLTNVLRTTSGKLAPAEKQKVSLGRGIVRENTAAVLLDEPLTSIDPKLKWELRRKLKEVQRQLAITMIYVTHDQQEALTFAENVTVMKDGRILQTGSPEDLYTNPESPFIGYFIGSPGMNTLDCSVAEGRLDFGAFSIPLSNEMRERLATFGNDFRFGIRPEAVRTSPEERTGWTPFDQVTVENTGAYKILTLAAGAIRIKARVSASTGSAGERQIWVQFPEEDAKFFKDDERIC